MHDSIVQTRANPPIRDPVEVDNAAARPSYTFVAAIAQGGMGYVELCCRREGRFIRWAARKRLHAQLRSDPVFRTMFMDEARVAGLVRHPNVVSVSDVGEDGDGPYLIMDYVEGVSLSRLFRQAARDRRQVPLQVAVRICKDAAIGLHAAHEVRAEDGSPLNLVHRDVSPQNVLIGFDGSVRVTDFGIAKALGNANQTTAGVLKGNMGYLSPEQLRFEEPDRRSDLFSLGVTLYELLSGERLYSNKAGFEGTRRILSEPAPDIRAVRPEVPEAAGRAAAGDAVQGDDRTPRDGAGGRGPPGGDPGRPAGDGRLDHGRRLHGPALLGRARSPSRRADRTAAAQRKRCLPARRPRNRCRPIWCGRRWSGAPRRRIAEGGCRLRQQPPRSGSWRSPASV